MYKSLFFIASLLGLFVGSTFAMKNSDLPRKQPTVSRDDPGTVEFFKNTQKRPPLGVKKPSRHCPESLWPIPAIKKPRPKIVSHPMKKGQKQKNVSLKKSRLKKCTIFLRKKPRSALINNPVYWDSMNSLDHSQMHLNDKECHNSISPPINVPETHDARPLYSSKIDRGIDVKKATPPGLLPQSAANRKKSAILLDAIKKVHNIILRNSNKRKG
jgi:hypothetical protein